MLVSRESTSDGTGADYLTIKFNERTETAHRTIEKVLKRDGKHVTGLYLMVDPDDEQKEGQDYRIFFG